jgi:hypothetical protein
MVPPFYRARGWAVKGLNNVELAQLGKDASHLLCPLDVERLQGG